MEREEVAAGDGALQTLITRLSSKIRKSSKRAPSRLHACARTPAPPGARSSSRISGSNFWSALVKAALESERYISPIPVRQYFETIFRKPGHATVSENSERLKSDFL